MAAVFGRASEIAGPKTGNLCPSPSARPDPRGPDRLPMHNFAGDNFLTVEAEAVHVAKDLQLACAEFYERANETITASSDYIHQNGLDRDELEAHALCLAVLPLEFCPPDRFDFTDQGELGAVIQATDSDGETLLDLVAWPLSDPTLVATMFGRAALVGAWQAMNPATYVFDQPLHVHRTPLAWLQADCQGCAVVVPRLAAHALLNAPGRIAGQDAHHTLELAKLVYSIVDISRFVAPVERAA